MGPQGSLGAVGAAGTAAHVTWNMWVPWTPTPGTWEHTAQCPGSGGPGMLGQRAHEGEYIPCRKSGSHIISVEGGFPVQLFTVKAFKLNFKAEFYGESLSSQGQVACGQPW